MPQPASAKEETMADRAAPRRCFELRGAARDAAGVLEELRVFLQELRASDAAELTLDVASMPVLADASFLGQLASLLGESADCFAQVERLRLVTAGGLQGLIARSVVQLLPPRLAVEVVSRERDQRL